MGDPKLTFGPVDMIDVHNAMQYAKEKYNATFEITWDSVGHGIGYGVLCVTLVAHCGTIGHRDIGAGWFGEPSAYDVRNMPKLLHEAVTACIETIDGKCPDCQTATAGRN